MSLKVNPYQSLLDSTWNQESAIPYSKMEVILLHWPKFLVTSSLGVCMLDLFNSLGHRILANSIRVDFRTHKVKLLDPICSYIAGRSQRYAKAHVSSSILDMVSADQHLHLPYLAKGSSAVFSLMLRS